MRAISNERYGPSVSWRLAYLGLIRPVRARLEILETRRKLDRVNFLRLLGLLLGLGKKLSNSCPARP